MSDGNDDELERFRQQWQQEVSRKNRKTGKARESTASTDSHLKGSASNATAAATTTIQSRANLLESSQAPGLGTVSARDNYQDTYVRGTYNFDDLEALDDARRLGVSGTGVHPEARSTEPQTALEHFELAVEKESQGNMQASLLHYRKAYKLDDQVDLAYRSKHFPPTKIQAKPLNVNPSNAAVTVPNTAHHSLHGGAAGAHSALIISFADSDIQPVIPEVEGAPQLPCPIGSIPREILVAILSEMALSDVASLMRMASTCKQLAYLIHVEDPLWRSACWNSKHGFSDMHYDFALTVNWQDVPKTMDEHLASLTLEEDISSKLTGLLPGLTPSYPTFLDNFHFRPRIRFSGVYISTVTYIRPGASTANSVYWGTAPVHMVTYYRYLRFYRDGSVISLLTTYEPHDVVPIFHKKNLRTTKDGKDRQPQLPGPPPPAATAQPGQGATAPVPPPTINAVMRYVKRGRWRLSSLQNGIDDVAAEGGGREAGKQAPEPEGNLYVETEGANPRYTYHMQFVLRSVRAPGVAQNTKLVWRSFWSHHVISDDWSEFTLRNDKAFVFSRVKSWVDA